jgi:multiple sugar transport system substrate-binding protein
MNTIKDVASEAGVSIATVSNYINNTKPVSPHTSQRIQKIINDLHYVPNLSAKSLKSNQSYDIGVILPNLSDSYYTQVYQGIEAAFQNSNYFLNLTVSYDIPEIELNIAQNFLKKNICGLILVTSRPENWRFYYENFTSQYKPLVLIDRLIDQLDANFVTSSNWQDIYQITSFLIKTVNEDVCLFAGSKFFSCEKECIDGYKAAFKNANLEVDPNKIIMTSLNKEDAFRHTTHFLKDHHTSAIITTSELCSSGIVEALTLLGFQTPEDIPVYALSEEHWNKFTHSFCHIAAVRPAIQIGRTAAELLIEQIKIPKIFEKQHIVLTNKELKFNSTPILVSENNPPIIKKPKSEINVLMLQTAQIEAIQGIIENFEITSNIHVNMQILPHQYLLDRIMEEQKSLDDAKQSDVYMFDIPWLYDLASSGILADITDFIKDPSFNPDIYLPNCLKYFSEFEGKYYGLPFMYAPQIFYYRKDLFNNQVLATEFEKRYHSKLHPPRTWMEFNAIAAFFTQCKLPENLVNYGTSVPTAYKECLVPEIYMRLWAYGGKVFNRHFHVTFDTPQTLKAYVNYKGTFKYAKPDFRTATDASVVSDFINGETAMLITYPSFLDIDDLRRSSLTGNIGYSLIPGHTPILGGWSIGINKRSSKKNEAFEFLSWTSTEKNANYFTLLGGQPAITSLFTNDELVSLYPWLPMYHSTYQYTQPVVPPYKKGKPIISQERIDSIISLWAMELIEDRIEVSEAIQHTQSDLELLFQSYGY